VGSTPNTFLLRALNAGVFTSKLQDGTWIYRHRPVDTGIGINECRGCYTVSGT
jgi:hypothetical protein